MWTAWFGMMQQRRGFDRSIRILILCNWIACARCGSSNPACKQAQRALELAACRQGCVRRDMSAARDRQGFLVTESVVGTYGYAGPAFAVLQLAPWIARAGRGLSRGAASGFGIGDCLTLARDVGRTRLRLSSWQREARERCGGGMGA